jgi:hypothetical protein
MARPMANDPPFATLNHFAGDSGIPSESDFLRIGINRLTEHVADLSMRLAGLEAGMAALTERMDRAETRLDRIESQLGLGVTISSSSD